MTTYLPSYRIGKMLGICGKTPRAWADRGLVRTQEQPRKTSTVTLICLEDCREIVAGGMRWGHSQDAPHPWKRRVFRSRPARPEIAPEMTDIIRRATVRQLWRLVQIRALEAQGMAMPDAVKAVFEVTR